MPMQTSHPRRWKGALAGLAILSAVAALFVATRADAPGSVVPLSRSPVSSSGSSSGPGVDVVGPTGHGHPPTHTAVAPPPTVAKTVELCGLGRVALVSNPVAVDNAGHTASTEDDDRDGPSVPAHLGQFAQDSAQSELLRVLQAGSDRQRAAHLMLMPLEETSAADIERELVIRSDRLLQIALKSEDPVIARWASGQCFGLPCSERSTARWAELDPSNAIPVLVLEGLRRPSLSADGFRDGTGYRDASQLPSHSASHPQPHAQTHDLSLAQTVMQSVPAHTLPYLRTSLVHRAIRVQESWTHWTRIPLRRIEASCVDHPRPDCGRWADALSTNVDSPDALKVAIAIGKSAGWGPERLLAVKAAQDLAQNEQDAPIDLSCSAADRLAKRVHEAN